MRSFIFHFVILLCLLAGNQAYACSIAPQYLDGEFGLDGVVLGNISEAADKIFIGRFRNLNLDNEVTFKPIKKIKPRRFFSTKNEISLSFRDMPNEKVHRYDEKDDQAFESFSELKRFVTQMRPSIASDNISYGTGGPIAGIHHGSDCERFVLAYLDQDYLIYLGPQNAVLASFPIQSVSKDFIDGASTLFAVD